MEVTTGLLTWLLLRYNRRIKSIFPSFRASTQLIPFPLLLGLLVITNIESLSANHRCWSLRLRLWNTINETSSIFISLILRILHLCLLCWRRHSSIDYQVLFTISSSIWVESLGSTIWLILLLSLLLLAWIIKIVWSCSHLDVSFSIIAITIKDNQKYITAVNVRQRNFDDVLRCINER